MLIFGLHLSSWSECEVEGVKGVKGENFKVMKERKITNSSSH